MLDYSIYKRFFFHSSQLSTDECGDATGDPPPPPPSFVRRIFLTIQKRTYAKTFGFSFLVSSSVIRTAAPYEVSYVADATTIPRCSFVIPGTENFYVLYFYLRRPQIRAFFFKDRSSVASQHVFTERRIDWQRGEEIDGKF